jgi:hypothetical protein
LSSYQDITRCVCDSNLQLSSPVKKQFAAKGRVVRRGSYFNNSGEKKKSQIYLLNKAKFRFLFAFPRWVNWSIFKGEAEGLINRYGPCKIVSLRRRFRRV